jgi:hypothetical protein
MTDIEYDYSNAAQILSLGQMNTSHRDKPGCAQKKPVHISGLEAIGHYIGCANSHPVRDAESDLPVFVVRENCAA